MKIYDGNGVMLGRIASHAAKDLLLGEEVHIINCEKIVISGKKTFTFALEKQKRDRRGYPLKSQKYSRLPDKFVRRSVRGMLPWKFNRGKEAFKNLKCHISIPSGLTNQKTIHLQNDTYKKLPTLYYTTVGETCKHLGGTITP